MDSGSSCRLIQHSADVSLPGHRLFAVGENKRSGLILCKAHYAEFAGPGAAISIPKEKEYVSVIAIGAPEIVEKITHSDRQTAYGRRIQWIRWLNRIVTHPDPMYRAEKLFVGFEEFFGSEVLANLPDSVMALLAGVLPHKIAQLRSQDSRYSVTPFSGQSNIAPRVAFISQDWLIQQAPSKPLSTLYSTHAAMLNTLPYSA